MDINELYISAVSLTRYLLAGLAVLITGGCVVSLVTRRFGSRVGSYLVEFKTKKRIPLTRWENSIGRSPTCDVILNVATVSRFHAVISKRRTGWVVADTGSRTGVYVNGEQIGKPVVLKHGDKVSFGTSVFEFFDVDVDDAEREAEKERRRQAKINARTVARADNRGASFLPAIIDEAGDKAYVIGCDSCTIGRSPDCDIRLKYHSLSSEHARVSKIGNGWYIEDLGSTNGTKVNARFVTNGRRKLRDGDIIGLGGVIFVFDEHYKIKKN
ncbi:MAG: FHA domain-containing protein [Clostridia bacterium]|nr:FHA domain-containing protein [Clostridia bacterium]